MLSVTPETSFDLPLVSDGKLKRALGLNPLCPANYAAERIRTLGLVLGRDVDRVETPVQGSRPKVRYRFTLRACSRIMMGAKGIHSKFVAQAFMAAFPALG